MFETGEIAAATHQPDEGAGALSQQPPGPMLAAALAEVNLAQVSDYDLVEVTRTARRMASWAQAIEHAATAELAGRPEQVPEFAADEIAAALTLTRASADRQLSLALELEHRLPATGAALSTGQIDLPKARVLADTTTILDATAAYQVEAAALDRASSQTTGQLRARAARLAAQVDPQAAAKRREKARRERRVVVDPRPDGTADLCGLSLPAETAAAAYAHVDAHARAARGADDARTTDQLRADVYAALLLGTAAQPNGGAQACSSPADHGTGSGAADSGAAARPAEPHPADGSIAPTAQHGGPLGPVAGRIHLTVSLTTLVGLAEEPGELHGYGPVTADIARKVAAAANRPSDQWCWSVTDPETGLVIHHGRTSYRPTGSLRSFIAARDVTCRAPGCRQPAPRCDIDHTVPHERGGITCPCNIELLCRHHHRMKHEAGWRLDQPWPGVFRWRSPAGHVYSRTSRGEPPGPDP